jgi:low temperature requirement protein LtrA
MHVNEQFESMKNLILTRVHTHQFLCPFFFNHPICLIFVLYIVLMEWILYFKIRQRGPLDSSASIVLNQSAADLSLFYGALPVKKILVGPTVSLICRSGVD